MANRNAYNVELLPCWHKGRSWDMLFFCDCWYIFAFFVFKFLCLYVFTCLYCLYFCIIVCLNFQIPFAYFWRKDRSCDMLASCDTAKVFCGHTQHVKNIKDKTFLQRLHLFFLVINVRDHYKQKCSFIPGSNTHPCRGVQKGFKFINSYRIQIDTKTLSSFQRH